MPSGNMKKNYPFTGTPDSKAVGQQPSGPTPTPSGKPAQRGNGASDRAPTASSDSSAK